MYKKDYIMVANGIIGAKTETLRLLELDHRYSDSTKQIMAAIVNDFTGLLTAKLATRFMIDNPRFDYDRFKKYIEEGIIKH